MHAFFLIAYLVLPVVAWWRSRSLAWTVIYTVGSVSIFGVGINFVIDHITPVTWVWLQWTMLIALLVPTVLAFLVPARRDAPRLRQMVTVLLPVGLLAVFFAVMTTWFTEVPALQTPVGFLMGYSTAEDNAEWLDFAALMVSANPIEQAVPLGGPLQLFLVAVSSLMAVVSQIVYGGINQVMVAANTVVFGQYALVTLAPLGLAPLAEVKIPGRAHGEKARRIPTPLMWAGQLVLVLAALIAVTYGHMTWQFVAIVVTLWVASYLVSSSVPRARLITSLAVAACMTVWVPLNAVAAVLIIGWLLLLVVRGIKGRAWDVVGLSLTLVVAIGLWQPLVSSIAFVTDLALGVTGTTIGGFGAGGVPGLAIPSFIDSTLFAAGGGVETVGPLLAALALVALLGAAIVWDLRGPGWANYVRLLPVGLLAGFVVAFQLLDQWTTGSAPNYGSSKFAFLVVVVIAAATIPVALMLISPGASGMTAARWVGVGIVILTLMLDSILVRAVAAARPEQWSPPIPFNNPQSYWWPAEVNGTADQPVSGNPIGCVYLPAGAKAPSGILDSGLSDPQRVYSCTRLLAGLAGEDTGAQPMVDWLRREWLTNQRAWEGVYGYLAGMPDSVLDRPVILLDDGSNVTGLETMRSLLGRFPADSWSRP